MITTRQQMDQLHPGDAAMVAEALLSGLLVALTGAMDANLRTAIVTAAMQKELELPLQEVRIALMTVQAVCHRLNANTLLPVLQTVILRTDLGSLIELTIDPPLAER